MEDQEAATYSPMPAAEGAAGPPSGAPVPPPPPVTGEMPSAAPYPPGYSPGTPPPPPAPSSAYGWTWGPVGPADASPSGSQRSGGWFSRTVRSALVAWIVAGVLAATVIGVSVGWATSSSAVPPRSFPSAGTPFGRGGFGGPGGGFGGGPGGGFGSGVVGTVASVSSGSFTVHARSGQTVTVDEQSSTSYYDGTSQATSSIVTTGATVAVQGSESGSTVTATRVTLVPAGGGGFFGAP